MPRTHSYDTGLLLNAPAAAGQGQAQAQVLPEEPAHLRVAREQVQKNVSKLVYERSVLPMETITSFFMRDSKGKHAKPAYLRLSRNHEVRTLFESSVADSVTKVLQFGDPETVMGDESRAIHFPLESMGGGGGGGRKKQKRE